MADAPKTDEKPLSYDMPDGRRQFIHLHTHSHYSLLDGLSKPDKMVKLAKSFGMPALAVTDHGNMYGAIDFYQECQKHGVKPIMGFEGYVANRTRFDKEPGIDNERFHLTLLAENNTGYQNLMKLVTKSHLEGYYYKPRMDKQLMREHHEGIIALSGCLGGEFCKALWNNDEEKAMRVAREYQEIFGKDNYFIEVMHHPSLERFNEIKEKIIRVARKLDIPLVGTQDSHYLHKDDARAHDTLLAIQTNSDLNNEDRFTMNDDDYSFIDTPTAYEHFKECPEAVENTSKIAERCNVTLTLGKFIFPEFSLPEGKNADDVLRELCYAGIPRRGFEGRQDVIDRLEHELGIIKMKGYATYFLVVEDLIRYADEHGILTNIRGSVAGSMTTYLLGITKVDPLYFKIPFERFLNPERPSAPDIDMDFADSRREEILEYAKKKYGENHVAQIGTFGTMLARAAVRDVARALGQPYAVGDKIAKLIPMGSQGFPMTIERAFELEPELKKLYDEDPISKEVLDLSKKLEGCVRHVSVHAAGVVISPKDLMEYAPLQFDPKGGKIITQYDMYTVGEDGVGLTKFDFLGIRNLSILADAVKIVKRTQAIDVDIENVPMDDKKTFQMLARGETMGLFQLNGSGMTKYLMDLKPTTIHDINAMVALYRPGPLEFIPEYIRRKHDPSLISYLDPALEEILKQTYGILVYQDDLLLMAHNLAGYSWGKVDKFRKAVGKKIPELMAEQKGEFIKGCIQHSGWSEEKATEVWTWLEPFAAYGFNKAHSVSYGRVAYQTAFMKANYPAEYMTAVLSAESGDVEEIAAIIAECKRMKIPVLPPDINESFRDFTVVKGATPAEDKIRFGLLTIKNLGEEIANQIIDERLKNGRFDSFAHLLDRIKHKNLNRKSLEALIKSGAMDAFGERGTLLANLEDALEYHREQMKTEGAQDSLFSLFGSEDTATLPTLKLKEAPLVPLMERLAWEKELLGLYVSGHPLDRFRDKFDNHNQSIRTIKEMAEGAPVVVAGLVEECRSIMTKNGDHMAFLKVADFTDSIETVIFPRTYLEYKDLIAPEMCLAIKGKVSHRNGGLSVIAEAVKKIEN